MNAPTQITEIVKKQRGFFSTHQTKKREFRREALRNLLKTVEENENAICEALHQDLRKSKAESFIGEISLVCDEAKYALKHLDSWTKPKRIRTPSVQMIARSYIQAEPLGTVLIIGPWNYPFQLLFAPLVAAIAAGNTVVLKPSELAPHTSKLVLQLLKNFPEEYVAVVDGGVETSQALLKEKWDHIFFTGGTEVGRLVAIEAAKKLTPVTLELGGKSPCIVDSTADMKVAARRIAWGKFFNSGQTCVAPDYLLVEKGMKVHLLEELKVAVDAFFGKGKKDSPDYSRIISARHYERLKKFIGQGKVAFGGETNDAERFIAPTVLMNVEKDAPVMHEEIFGPILPVIEYASLDEAIEFILSKSKPLALYLFSDSRDVQERILNEVSFGGGCINDTLIHLTNARLPFGGVGDSGMGNYHGKFGFDTFSHFKSIVKRSFFPDLMLRYPPYEKKLSLLRKLLG